MRRATSPAHNVAVWIEYVNAALNRADPPSRACPLRDKPPKPQGGPHWRASLLPQETRNQGGFTQVQTISQFRNSLVYGLHAFAIANEMQIWKLHRVAIFR